MVRGLRQGECQNKHRKMKQKLGVCVCVCVCVYVYEWEGKGGGEGGGGKEGELIVEVHFRTPSYLLLPNDFGSFC